MSVAQSIQGLASGLDTASIIDALVEYERKPAVLMETQQAELTKEISSFKALAAKVLALQSSMAGLTAAGALNQASLDVSLEDLITATADGTVSAGTYVLNILSLAKNHQIASQGFADPTQTVFGTGTITLAMGDHSATTIQIGAGENSLVGIKKAINDANIGITASIVNDGSSSRPYRLVLTGGETGQKNTISVTSSLSGGLDVDFATASFDDPETVRFSAQTTAAVGLGATAAYTGTTNKSFTFTVGGNGAQTVGQGNITLNWTDGTNSGTLIVSQADTEISGPEGLKLSFTDGALVGGDSFRVNTFAPLVQQATDASISIGSTDQGASPIVVRSATNDISEAIPGVKLTLKGLTTTTTGPVTVKTGFDSSAVRTKIEAFIKAYNDVISFIDEQSKYDTETKETGILIGDSTVMTIQSRLRRVISEPVAGLDKTLNALSAIGIRTDSSGHLMLKDSTKLTAALAGDFESVVKLFTDSGDSSREGISFVGTSAKVKGGSTFGVNITQVATHGYLQGQKITDPTVSGLTLTASDNKLKLRVDGIVSDEIALSARTYASGEDLATELQTRINADKKIGNRGIHVEWVDLGDEGYLKLSASSYGSTSKVEVIASVANGAIEPLGLSAAMVHAGDDVAGTINGEKAIGQGQFLTGAEKNLTTSGVKLLITLTASQLADGDEGDITVTRGVATLLKSTLESITQTENGVISRKTAALDKQVAAIKEQIAAIDARLVQRRQTLEMEFQAMETALSQMQTQSSFLESQLSQASSNLSSILGKK